MRKNRPIIVLFLLSALYCSYSQSIIDKALDEAKAFYLVKDYSQAYLRIRFVLRNFQNYNDIPMEIAIISENIYYDYLDKLSNEKNENKISDIIYKDNYYLMIAENSKRIAGFKLSFEKNKEIEQKKREIEEKKQEEERIRKEMIDLQKSNTEQFNKQLEMQLKEQEKKASLELKQKQIEYEKFLKAQELLNKEKLESESQSREQLNKILETTINSRKDEAKTERENLIFLIVAITVIIVVLFILLFLVIMYVLKSSHKHQERMFEFQMQNLKLVTAGMLEQPRIANSHQYLIANGNITDVKALPVPDESMQKIQVLLTKAKLIGEEIEKKTSRKNSCKNAAELVYKITKSFDYDDKTSMIYFCATLIHDIGLLDLEENLFKEKKLTDEQFEKLKGHTKIHNDRIEFIGEEFKSIFIDAITKHHENIDGSGYPNGLSDGEIPEIARMIRVVESYIALVSSRVYRNISDKQEAIKELLENNNKYDIKIVEALDNVL